MLIVEDTHASYMKKFNNPSSHSFINFAKKEIDDINSNFPGLPKMEFSLNKYLYSLEFFESIVAFKIDQKKCVENSIIKNQGEFHDIKDFRDNDKSTFPSLLRFKFIKYFVERFNELKLKKYFK